jgi:hypothetical protein
MIQFKRGSSESWGKIKNPLADGQPGYDRDRKKIKIGDGESSWDKLPYASGMSAEEILSSEEDAKKRVAKVPGLGLIGNAFNKILSVLKLDDRPIFTYGEEAPNENTVGRVYLQYYDTAPEVDYVVEYGVDGIWTFRKWNSGIAECWGVCEITTAIRTASEGHLYSADDILENIKYPFTFLKVPSETVTVQSSSGFVWLASNGKNNASQTAAYNIVSIDSLNSSTYTLSFSVTGYWK